jgi:hypothetical protein
MGCRRSCQGSGLAVEEKARLNGGRARAAGSPGRNSRGRRKPPAPPPPRPGANFRPQRQQVAEAFRIEPGVDIEAECGVDEQVVGALRHRVGELELFLEQSHGVGAVRRITHPAQRGYERRDIALERGAMLARAPPA